MLVRMFLGIGWFALAHMLSGHICCLVRRQEGGVNCVFSADDSPLSVRQKSRPFHLLLAAPEDPQDLLQRTGKVSGGNHSVLTGGVLFWCSRDMGR